MQQAPSAAFPWSHIPRPEPGEKRTGQIRWADRLLAGLAWPYFAARGAHDGPAVLVVAALGGRAYPGVLAARRLGRVVDPARLHGSLVIVPVVNLPAFWERASRTPHDGRDLDRQFPGRASGAFGERLAFHLTRDIVSPADVIVDLRAGDDGEALAPYASRVLSGDATIDALTRRMVDAVGVSWAMTLSPAAALGSLTGTASRLGKAAISVAFDGAADDTGVARGFQGLVNVLRALEVFEGQPLPTAAPRWLDPGDEPRAAGDALWRPAVALEQPVQPGELLGSLSDLLGEPLAEVRAERAGVVLACCIALAVRAGDRLAWVCPPRA